jgi:ribosomal protein S18 acetylase RimI-like enzyme
MSDTSCVVVRGAVPEDAAYIRDFNIAMARETESRELDVALVDAGVRRLFGQPEYGFYLIATCGGEVAGCLMVTTEWSDWRDGLFWWIQSVYVVPGYRRRGVFRALYDHVLARAQADTTVCGLRLYVERDNVVARSTYSELGMVETPYVMYEEEFERE